MADLMDGDDQMGEITLVFTDEDVTEFKIDYVMDVDPGCGSDCFFAIYDGISCDDKGDKYFGTEENPWNDADSTFGASSGGAAAGVMTIDAGKDYGDIHCTVMVVYGPPPDSGSKSKSRRNLKKSKEGPDVLMCGVLKKDGFDGSCKSTKKSKSRRNRN